VSAERGIYSSVTMIPLSRRCIGSTTANLVKPWPGIALQKATTNSSSRRGEVMSISYFGKFAYTDAASRDSRKQFQMVVHQPRRREAHARRGSEFYNVQPCQASLYLLLFSSTKDDSFVMSSHYYLESSRTNTLPQHPPESSRIFLPFFTAKYLPLQPPIASL
jgi:hypothetical protein